MEDEKEEKNVDTQPTTDNNVQEKQEQGKSGNKNEGEKIKKSVAQKGENGEIIFKNQDELNGFIARKYAQGAEKAGQSDTSKQVQETSKTEEQPTANQSTVQDYTAQIALAMAKAGVDVNRAERAARLVNMSKVLENGTVNTTKLDDEIKAVIAEIPELLSVKEEKKEEKGFKFGATEGASDSNQEKKKPMATKRWNRFNSF